MNRLTTAGGSAVLIGLLIAALTQPASAAAASDAADTSIAVDPATQIAMHVNADCAANRCTFNTTANLLTPNGPTGFPDDTWARQTITLRSSDRNVWQEASYSAPTGTPRVTKGANNSGVLSKMYRSTDDVEISVTYFNGGPIERFKVDGDSVPTDWSTGQPTTRAAFIVCTHIQVVYGGVNLTTPDACAQTTF